MRARACTLQISVGTLAETSKVTCHTSQPTMHCTDLVFQKDLADLWRQIHGFPCTFTYLYMHLQWVLTNSWVPDTSLSRPKPEACAFEACCMRCSSSPFLLSLRAASSVSSSPHWLSDTSPDDRCGAPGGSDIGKLLRTTRSCGRVGSTASSFCRKASPLSWFCRSLMQQDAIVGSQAKSSAEMLCTTICSRRAGVGRRWTEKTGNGKLGSCHKC